MQDGAPAGLWPFALRVYGSPGVAPACLALQERFGLDVNLLLFAAWMARRGRALSPDELASFRAEVAPWHEEVVRALRAVRMRLKSGPPPAPSAATETLRNDLKRLEIQAERLELETLERLGLEASPGTAAPVSAAANLGHVVQLFGGALDADARDHIATVSSAASAAAPA